jgi:hypothetical protein
MHGSIDRIHAISGHAATAALSSAAMNARRLMHPSPKGL